MAMSPGAAMLFPVRYRICSTAFAAPRNETRSQEEAPCNLTSSPWNAAPCAPMEASYPDCSPRASRLPVSKAADKWPIWENYRKRSFLVCWQAKELAVAWDRVSESKNNSLCRPTTPYVAPHLSGRLPCHLASIQARYICSIESLRPAQTPPGNTHSIDCSNRGWCRAA